MLRVKPVALACWKDTVHRSTFQVSHVFLPVHYCSTISLSLSLSWAEAASHFTTWWQVFMLANFLFPFVSDHIVVYFWNLIQYKNTAVCVCPSPLGELPQVSRSEIQSSTHRAFTTCHLTYTLCMGPISH